MPIGTNLFFCTELGYGNLKISSAGKEMTNNFFTSTIGLKYASFPYSNTKDRESLLAFHGNINAGLAFYNVKAIDYNNNNQIYYQSNTSGDKTGVLISSMVGVKFNIANHFYINLNYNYNLIRSRNFIIPFDNFNIRNQGAENITFSSIGIGFVYHRF